MGASAEGRCTITLPRRVFAALALHCAQTGEQPADVVGDAVELLLDELGTRFDPRSPREGVEVRAAEKGDGASPGPVPVARPSTPPPEQLEIPAFLPVRRVADGAPPP